MINTLLLATPDGRISSGPSWGGFVLVLLVLGLVFYVFDIVIKVTSSAVARNRSIQLKDFADIIKYDSKRFFEQYPTPLKSAVFFLGRCIKVILFICLIPAIASYYFLRQFFTKK